MDDSSTLVFNLFFAGTLGIGFLMFLVQLAAFIVLLAVAATVEFLVVTLAALVPRTRKSAPHRQLHGRHYSRMLPSADALDG